MEPAPQADFRENTSPLSPLPPLLTPQLADSLVGLVLQAAKSGGLRELMSQRRGATRWLVRRYLRAILGTAGAALERESAEADAALLFLQWALGDLRPDRQFHGSPIDRVSWLDRTSWRPLLALQCHYGLLQVPDFSDRYRRRPDESAADNLCGLWSVGPSTFYRYLDKGKRLLAESMLLPPSGERRLSLRRFTQRHLDGRGGGPAGPAWHQRQAQAALTRRDPCSALWHLAHADDAEGFIDVLRRQRTEVAGDPEADPLIDFFGRGELTARRSAELRLARAALWQTRNLDERAMQACQEAIGIANAAGDMLMLGVAYGELGQFHEARDTDRALSCHETSAEYLRQAGLAGGQQDPAAFAGHYVSALQRLAWFHVLRNDPRSIAALESAEQARAGAPVPERAVALLEQTWGEYWRRAGDLRRSIEHKHRALTIFERVGDMRNILSTYNNLCMLYCEEKDFARAIDYAQRVLATANQGTVDPYIVANTRINLGNVYFWQDRHDLAIEQYERVLAGSLAARLPVLRNRARYNLAESFYKRFKLSGDPEDERRGDEHIGAVLQASPSEKDSWFVDAAPQLKREILNPRQEGHVHERLWPDELATYFEEMSEVQRQRARLTLPCAPRERVRAHLAIANAYLAISTREREAAVELIRQHALGGEFDTEIDALQITFSRELTREKVLLALWRQKSYGVLTEERAAAVLRQVLEAGAINKSGYAQLCQVGLATASKHLGTLAERGLLQQTGKGPSTRYVLPPD